MLKRLRRGRRHAAVIVLGVQKSGTTAIATLLAHMTGQALASDFMHREPTAVRTRLFDRELPFEEFVRRHSATFRQTIVKDPNLSFFLPDLRATLPATRLLFISRDPRDAIRSQLDRWGLPGDRDEVDRTTHPVLVEHENWELILQGRWPRLEGDNYVERLAGRWCLAARMYLAHQEDVVLLRYEDFLVDKMGTLRWLADELGLEVLSDIATEVDTPFQPPGRPRPWLEVFGRQNLRRIETVCAEPMKALGYSPIEEPES